MPFHVEIGRRLHHARVFNLERGRARRTSSSPGSTTARSSSANSEWDPRESELKILEGPQLEPPDLSFGQGWSNAERRRRT